MDTHGHEEVLKVTKKVLEEAFSRVGKPNKKKRLNALFLGNWLTDMTNFFDENTWATIAGVPQALVDEIQDLLDAPLESLQQVADEYLEDSPEPGRVTTMAKDASRLSEKARKNIEAFRLDAKKKIEVLFGKPGKDLGDIAAYLRDLIKVKAYFKFAYPKRKFDFDSFMNVFDMFFPKNKEGHHGENKGKYGFTGCYYPHQHMDRWPASETSYKTQTQRCHSRFGTEITPGIFPYMHDFLQYAAGHLADLDLNWAEPTFRRKKFVRRNESGEPTREVPLKDLSSNDKEFEKAMDERMAQLGHTLHVVEDFFAHSTFVEHGLRLVGDQRSKPLFDALMEKLSLDPSNTDQRWWTEWALKVGWETTKTLSLGPRLFAFVPKDLAKEDSFKRFSRRLLKFDPSVHMNSKRTEVDNDALNSTDYTVEEPNVVTGFFDTRDMIVSLDHVLMELFGWKLINGVLWYGGRHLPKGTPDIIPSLERKSTPDAIVRDVFDVASQLIDDPKKFAERKIRRLADRKIEEFTDVWEDVQDIPDTFQIKEEVARELLGPLLPSDTEDEIKELLLKCLIGLTRIKIWGGRAISAYEAIQSVVKILSIIRGGPAWEALAAELVGEWAARKYLGRLLSYYVGQVEQLFKDKIGSLRIGCHSLIAKDHESDICGVKALECAKATDYYIVTRLLRGVFPQSRHAVCKTRPGADTANGRGRNILNSRYWIDWTELLEFFYRHPGGERSETSLLCAVSHVHRIREGDTLAKIADQYRGSAIDPATFDGGLIAKSNFGADETVDHKLRPGRPLNIPMQQCRVHLMVDKKAGDRWFTRVMNTSWEEMKLAVSTSRSGCYSWSLHNPIPLTRGQVEAIRDRGLEVGDHWIKEFKRAAAGQAARRPDAPATHWAT